MSKALKLNPDRLFPADNISRAIAQNLYQSVKDLPIISPHGHTDPIWWAHDENFGNASELLIHPDHYVFRMLYSQGIALEDLGIGNADADPRETWRLLAQNYHLFRGTPSRLWLDWVFAQAFGIDVQLSAETSDHYFDHINEKLSSDAFKPRALFDRYNIEVIATTEGPLDDLRHHQTIIDSDWNGRVITAYRPDAVIDPEGDGFLENLATFSAMTGEDCFNWRGYLAAHRKRRAYFKQLGATSTDHGHPSARTADLSETDAEALFARVIKENVSAEDAELFRAQMLTEMAGMSQDDGLVMQLHPGVYRNHNPYILENFGRDKGADIPLSGEFVHGLRPLLSKFGNNPDFTFILFTLDETTYARELAPLAGHYPALKLGPAWWFNDSPEGMRRFREMTTETAGFYNSVGFNDDTRAFMSIPARHDVARRMDCGFLAQLVADHRMDEDEAAEVAADLAYNLAKNAYKL